VVRILLKGADACPVIECDVCRLPITDHKNANAAYVHPSSEGTTGECFHIHKGCDQKLRERLGVQTSWQPLRTHLQYLTINVGLTPDALREDSLDQLG